MAGKGLRQSLGDHHSCQEQGSSGAHLIQLSIQPEGWRQSCHDMPLKKLSSADERLLRKGTVPFINIRAMTAITAITADTARLMCFASYTCMFLEDLPELCTRFSCS